MSKKKLIGIIGACVVVVIVVIIIITHPLTPSPTDTYTLSVSISPSGAGSISPSGGEYESGVQVTLIASPADGYQFVNWTGDTSTIANPDAATTTITMNGDYSITANFGEEPEYIPISCSADSEGWSVDFECEEEGQEVTKTYYRGFHTEFKDGKLYQAHGEMDYEFETSGNVYHAIIDVVQCEESTTGYCMTVEATGGLLGSEPVTCKNF